MIMELLFLATVCSPIALAVAMLIDMET